MLSLVKAFYTNELYKVPNVTLYIIFIMDPSKRHNANIHLFKCRISSGESIESQLKYQSAIHRCTVAQGAATNG